MISSRFKMSFVAALIGVLPQHVNAQTSVSLNLDYAEGRYGESERSVTWTMPLIIKRYGPDFGVKLYLPYVRATGRTAAGGDRFSPTRQSQEGFGDPVITVAGALIGDRDADLLVDLAGKVKLPTTDRRLDLITTGEIDYSLQADIVSHRGKYSVFATFGHTQKGNPPGVTYRDPWYYSLGLERSVGERLSAGVSYDYRTRLGKGGANVSEAMLYVEHDYSREFKWQAYLVRGFADASPDLGAGATLTFRF